MADRSIYVMGSVGHPGRYAFEDKLSFLDIISAADGPTAAADLLNIRVSHRGEARDRVTKVNLAQFFETGDDRLLPHVKPGDVIFVPDRNRNWLEVSPGTSVRLLGSVNKPGRYQFNDGMTILDLLAVAGPGFQVRKVIGGTAELMGKVGNGFAGHAGIGHTRWATHGRAEVRNAHPHVWDGVAVVHNGIIENYHDLRGRMLADGETFESDTDSEVIPHLIAAVRNAGAGPIDAVRSACTHLHGAYAIAVLFQDTPDRVVVARQGSPVMVARGPHAAAVASDPAALSSLCDDYAALEDGDMAELSSQGVAIFGRDGKLAQRTWQKVEGAEEVAAAGLHGSFTRAEIAAQPVALRNTDAVLAGKAIPQLIADAERLVVVACGSSMYAASTVRPWIEKLTGIPCDLKVASEYRTREAPLSRGTVAVLVSQSGETADTLGVMKMLKQRGVPIVAVVNVAHSQMARNADLLWPTMAGREQGVAATISFTCQMLALIRFGLALGLSRGTVTSGMLVSVERELEGLPAVCARTEMLEGQFESVAEHLVREGEALFIGRGSAAALANEGALKLKELSYLRAEAYAAGELKHGPIAMIREGSPVIVCAGAGQHAGKTLANAEEVRARGGYVIALVDDASAAAFAPVADEMIVPPGAGLGTLFAQAVAVSHELAALVADVRVKFEPALPPDVVVVSLDGSGSHRAPP